MKNKQRALKKKFQDNEKTLLKVKILVKIFKTQSSYSPLTSTSPVDFAMTCTPTNLSTKKLWTALTPNSKKKATSALKEKDLPGSVKSDIRKGFGLNISRDVPTHWQIKQI